MNLPRVLVLTDSAQLPPGRSLADQLLRCRRPGVGFLLREQRELLAGLTGYPVYSSRTELPGTDGVHLAARQPAVVGPFGRSCHDLNELTAAAAEGARYVTYSPVAPSPSKPGYGPPLGVDGLRRACRAVPDLPIYALGGVDPDNAAGFRAAGAHGVAVMGIVMRAADPAAVVADLLAAVGS